MKEIKSRKNYYSNEFDSDRASTMLLDLISHCSFKEISWIYRNIVYDWVAYWSSESKGKVYDGTYSDLNIEQANRLQQQISSLADLFEQSVIDKREFNEDYLKNYAFAGPYIRLLNDRDERIKQLEEAIEEMNSKIT